MNYYKARQHKDTKKWKYTMVNDGKIYEVGYCATEGCKGHDTPEEACEHYKQYLIDKRLNFFNPDKRLKFFNPAGGDVMYECKICGEFTQGFVTVNMQSFPLCEKCQTKENVSELMGSIGEIVSSY